jgi:hypothetical protein
MIVPVMGSAQRYREFIAHLSSHCTGLGKSEVMGVGRTSPANQARMGCDEFEMAFIAMPTHLADRELAFIDFGCRCGRLKGR